MAPRITATATADDPAAAPVEPVALDVPAPPPPAETPAPVKARWVDVQTVFVPGQGLIGYGDPIQVSPEQLAGDSHPTIAWDDAWTADPVLLEQATKIDDPKLEG